MNLLHHWLCRSDRWRRTIAQRLPWAIGNTDLGPHVLEIGPGHGVTTDLLRTSVPRLSALEVDPTLARALRARLTGSNVQVIEGDAAAMPFGDAEFSAAVSFTMLHHVPSPELQNRVLAELFRVLKPGGVLVGTDSLTSRFMKLIHIGDTLVPVPPATFGARLERAGFQAVEVHTNAHAFRFRARRPLSVVQAVLLSLTFASTSFAATGPDSCATSPAHRQLDYWLGSWTIGAPGSSGNAHSTVTLSLDKCVVVETWDGGRGHYGQNVFGYSADDKSWYGMFADNEGRVHVFTSGKVTSDTAELDGTSRGPNGETVWNRVRVIRLDPSRVEQTWEKSTDTGAHWNVAFRGEYSRPTDRALLILGNGDGTLRIVNPATLTVTATVPVGPDPHEVIASTDGSTAYVSNYGGGAYNTLTVVDLATDKPLPTIDLGPLRGPHGLTFVGGRVWFTAEAAKAIGSYDPATRKVDWILGTAQNRTHMIYVAPDANRVVTTNVSSATVSIMEKVGGAASTGPASGDWNETIIPAGRGSEGFDVSPDGREVWVANADDGTVSIIDAATKKPIATLAANVPGANRLKFTPDGKLVFISSLNAPDVVVIDRVTRKEVKRIRVGHGSAGILMQPDGSRAYVACSPDGYVAVIDTHSLAMVARIEGGQGPDGLAWVGH